jgi:hypothetical protein
VKRFSIRQLMILIAVIAACFSVALNGAFSGIAFLYVICLGMLVWFPSRGRLKAAPWAFFASAAWLNISMFVFFAYYPVFHNSMLPFLPSLIFVPIVAGLGLVWVAGRPIRSQRLCATAAVIALTALPCTMIAYRWPLTLAFHFSSTALNRLADRVQSGGKVAPGEWAGIYRVWGSMKDAQTGEPILVIDPDPRGTFSFIRHANSPGERSDGNEHFDGGRWSAIDLD